MKYYKVDLAILNSSTASLEVADKSAAAVVSVKKSTLDKAKAYENAQKVVQEATFGRLHGKAAIVCRMIYE
jgi:hypothetical protein